ncbi:MAG TPA: matrixin family metalloprotease [Methylibium sp.]|nr:matrixin family metalloprotease [Methylibium sp.]
MPITTDPLDALLAIRDGNLTARWNFYDAVGTDLANPGGIGNAASLTYSFLSAVPSYFSTSGFEAFSTAERNATREVLEVFSSVARVDFTEVAGVGTMTFGMNAQGGTAGYAYYPSFGYGYDGDNLITSVTAADLAGDVWFNSSIAWTADDFTPGGSGYGTLIHEIGHAIGLKHPFEGNHTLEASLDSLQ